MVETAIVNIGTELVTGLRVNTNMATLCRKINAIGGRVKAGFAVGDNIKDIEDILRYALQMSDIVITTGGLGPTADDVTKEAIASFCNKKLIFNEQVWQRIKEFKHSHHLSVKEEYIRAQAFVPQDSAVFPNRYGTAPGFAVERDNKFILALPGVPWEMENIWEEHIKSWWKEQFGERRYYVRVIHTIGLKESEVVSKLKELFDSNVGVLASPGKVDIFISTESRNTIEEKEKEIRKVLNENIFGTDDTIFEEELGKLLRKKKLKISVAESCTGGLTAHKITNIPGSSDYFVGGVISYHTSIKNSLLKVPTDIIEKYGVVSTEVAEKMAEGIKKLTNTEIGVGITGIAGPSGGTQETPVGTVCIAISTEKTLSRRFHFIGNRVKIKEWASNMVLFMVWKEVK